MKSGPRFLSCVSIISSKGFWRQAAPQGVQFCLTCLSHSFSHTLLSGLTFYLRAIPFYTLFAAYIIVVGRQYKQPILKKKKKTNPFSFIYPVLPFIVYFSVFLWTRWQFHPTHQQGTALVRTFYFFFILKLCNSLKLQSLW